MSRRAYLRFWGDTCKVFRWNRDCTVSTVVGTLHLEHTLDLYLDELAKKLESQHGRVVGITTIWCTLQHLGLRKKKVRL